MLSETDWIRTPHIRPDHRGPAARSYTPLPDPVVAAPIIQSLQSLAALHPHAVAFEGDDGALSFAQFLAAAERLRARIDSVRPRPGPVGILLPPSTAYAVAVFACLAARRMCLLLDDTYPEERNAAIAAAAGASLILTAMGRGAALAWSSIQTLHVPDLFDEGGTAPLSSTTFLGLDEPAFLLCTSGSSGFPKTMVHSQRTMLHWARTTHEALHVGPEDRVLSVSSPSSLGGFTALISYPLAGASIQMFDIRSGGFDALISRLAERPVTILRASPSLLRACTTLPDAPSILSGLRVVQSYGEPFTKADLAALRAVLPADCRIRTTYGSTESSGMSWFAGEPDAYDSVRVATGALMPDTAAAIVDERGTSCAPGEVGELLIRSRYNALGEWRQGRMESGGLQPHPSGDGTSIFRTGDLARYHPDGVFVVLGRKDRMIKINGQRLEPAEIECVLRSIPSVDRAELIVHRPAAYPGRPRLVAFVVPRCASPTLVSDIRAELKRKLPAYMIPSRILLTESIPLLPSGKTDTLALVALAEGHMAAAAP